MEHKTVEDLQGAIDRAKYDIDIILDKLAQDFPIAKDIYLSEVQRPAYESKRANRLYKVTIEC